MKYLVFGANGRIGSLVVQQLLAQNQQVIAFVRGKHNFQPNNNLKIHKGDIYNKDQVASAVQQASVVISCLGSWGTPKKDILTIGMKNIVPAMEKYKLSRIVTLTGADARTSSDQPNIIQKANHALIKIIAKKILEDGENHIKLLEQTNLKWTVLRSPVMTNSISDYQLTNKLPWPFATISRQAVASSLVDVARKNIFIQQAPIISKK